jgi:hypothetical protein
MLGREWLESWALEPGGFRFPFTFTVWVLIPATHLYEKSPSLSVPEFFYMMEVLRMSSS